MKGTRTLDEAYLEGIEDLYDLKKDYITVDDLILRNKKY